MNLALPDAATSGVITGAGFVLGVALLIAEHLRWWRGSGGAAAAGGKGNKGGPVESAGKAKDPKELLPYWFGNAFGHLMVACPAGLLGVAAGLMQWGGNTGAGTVMDIVTGQTAPVVATASVPALDWYGALVVLAVVLVLWMLRKSFAKVVKGRWWRGVFSGTLLAIGTGTFALIGDTVIPGANDLGAWAFGGLVSGALL